jgi:hypothetical protein
LLKPPLRLLGEKGIQQLSAVELRSTYNGGITLSGLHVVVVAVAVVECIESILEYE